MVTFTKLTKNNYPDSKIHEANMGPTSVLSAPDRPHVGFLNLAIRVHSSQIAYIGGPPKTRQFFRPHPPADSQRIRWWDAGKMAIGLCHVPLAESAQTASGWASGHWRHAGGFRSRQAGRDGQPALHQRISFEPDGHKRDPPVRRPFITLAVWTIRCFFPWFLFLLTF